MFVVPIKHTHIHTNTPTGLCHKPVIGLRHSSQVAFQFIIALAEAHAFFAMDSIQ